MSDLPAWLDDDQVGEPHPGEQEVDWAALPEDWRHTSWRIRRVTETRAAYANRVRAHVVEGSAPAEQAGRLVEWLEAGGMGRGT